MEQLKVDLQVGLENVVPVRLRHRQDQTVARDAGVVDQDVQIAIGIEGELHQRAGLGHVPDVGLVGDGRAARPLDLGHHRLTGLGIGVVVDDHARLAARQLDGDGASDPARGARHQGHFPVERHAWTSS